MDRIATTEAAFRALASEYADRKREAEAGVRRWQWWSNGWYDLRPLYYERMGFAPGRPLRSVPDDPRDRVAHGLDADGLVRVAREHNEYGFYEAFFDRSPDGPAMAYYDYSPEKRPVAFLQLLIDGGQPVESHYAARQGYTRERYRWDGDLLVAVDSEHAARSGGPITELSAHRSARMYHDPAGVLQKVETLAPPHAPGEAPKVLFLPFIRRGGRIVRRIG